MIDRNALNRRVDSRCSANAQGSSSACKQMQKKLQAIDFSMVDTILYLDAYPDCEEALKYFKSLKAEREKLLAEMKSAGCAPITAVSSSADGKWDWTNSPWPWENEAN